MTVAVFCSLFLAFVAASALAFMPLPPPTYLLAGSALAPSGTRALARAVSSRIRGAYFSKRRVGAPDFWHNLQVLRVISAFSIVYIHLEGVLAAFGPPEAFINLLRFGTDLFVVVAGFLSAHLLSGGRRTGGSYLRNRLIRIVPLYLLFTLLAFFTERYLMHNHGTSLSELALSLAFIPYGPFPILYPAWTLEVIVAFSIVLSLFLVLSTRNGVYYACGFVILVVFVGMLVKPTNPTLAFYTNPMLLDFALGAAVFKLVSARPAIPQHRLAGIAALATVAAIVLICLRPIYWPQAPRILGLGLPVTALVCGVLLFEKLGFFVNSRLVNLLARCTYAIYLTHWFTNILSEKLVSESHNSRAVASLLLLVTPILVTYLAIFIHLYIEQPATDYLNRVSRQGILPALKAEHGT